MKHVGTRAGRWWQWGLLLCMAAAPGCRSLFTTAVYVIRGTNTPAEYTGLNDKKVAVVCRPLQELQYSSAGACRDVAANVAALLKRHARRVKVIDPEKVERWVDENGMEDFVEVGRAVEADLVLAIDLESFNWLQGHTVYQGKADVLLTVHDVRDDTILWQKRMKQVVYPTAGVAAQDYGSEDQFRREFIGILADEIARHFYPHDATLDYARDSRALGR
ncbi:MAG: hypothetical protein K6T86_09600 [Pirellulales bacterium]|jgi:hypothetical protein|nr:hypothetical protein [Pirellulales bacterium]